MAQVLKVQQVPASPLNGHSSSSSNEKNGMSITDDSSSSSLTHLQNGSVLFHGTPTKEMNGHQSTSLMESSDDLQLSPSDLRRRSTRASALKAQEKIKLKDDIVQGPQKRVNDGEMEDSDGILEGNDLLQDLSKKVKKRRLEDGRDLDQTCFRFGLRTNDDGEVYAMTDESENSSIHESEMEIVRYHYEKMKNRELDEEQLRERLKMRREAEQQLREEEAKLQVLKKMKDSQNRAINKLAAETKAADLADAAAAAAAAAYKPVMAAGGKLSANGKNQTAMVVNKTMATLSNLTVPQQLELLGKLASQSPAAKQAFALAKKNPAQTTQLFAQLIQLNTMQVQKQKDAAQEAAAQAAQAAASSVHTIQHVPQNPPQQQQQIPTQSSKLLNQQTPAQRIQAARLAFRAQADKQLMTIPTQKSQPHDITFLPNPNASSFLALHGLDLTVQYVLKDKSVFESYSDPSYECEECKTDHAHTWKAIGSTPDDLHLYCENCVRSAQKRKNRTDQTNLLKRAFQKISAQEKEFEKKIAEGQLEQFAEAKAAVATAAAPATQQIPTSSTATVSSTPLPPRLQQLPSSSGSSTPTHHKAALPPTPKSSTSANAKKAISNQQAANQMMVQMMQNSMKNPQMMQQLSQMFTMAAAQQQLAAAAATQSSGGGRNAATAAANGMNSQMALFMAQAQAMAQVQAAQAAQQAAKQAQAQQAQQAQANLARETAHQQQQQMLFALLASQSGINNQALQQQIRNLTPTQQKSLYESLKIQQQQRK